MDLLTVSEAASILRVTPITVRRFIAGGRLKAVRVGRGVRIDRQALDALATPIESTGPTPRRPRQQRTLSQTDSLWQLVGSATDADPTDASRHHSYLAHDPD
jgi:excisionase family DNA binding protein